MKGLLTSISCRDVGKEDSYTHLFVRCEDGQRRRYSFHSKPYFYIEKEHIDNIQAVLGPKLSSRIRGVDRHGKRMQGYITGTELCRLYVKQPKDTYSIRNVLKRKGISTWEADIPFVNRYLIDTGIKLAVNIDTVNDIDIVTADPSFYCKTRYWIIDIEVLVESEEQKIDVKSNEPIINIGVYDNFDNKYYILYIGEGEMLVEKNAIYLPFKNEKYLLDYYLSLMEKKDPDILTGFNIKDYDFPKIMWRCRHLGLDPRRVSPLLAAYSGSKNKFKIHGREIIDIYEISRFLLGKELRHHSLDYVNKVLGAGRGKDDIGHSYNNTWNEDKFTLLRYNKRDLDCVLEILLEQDLILYLDEIRRLTGVTYDDILYKTTVFDMYIMRMLEGKKILPTKSHAEGGAGFVGAYVEKPEPGLYHNVLVIDFESLYPNLFITFNIGYESLVGSEDIGMMVKHRRDWLEAKSDIMIPGISNTKDYVETRDEHGNIELDIDGQITYVVDDEGENILQTKQRDVNYYIDSSKPSIIVEVLKELQGRRNETKAKIRNAKTQNEQDLYNKQDAAFKSVVNSAYGVMGRPGFRLFKPGVGEACCNAGRLLLKFAIQKAREWGYNVFYGDTDSIFIALGKDYDGDPVKDGIVLADRINVAIAELLPTFGNTPVNTIKMDMETVYESMAIWGKKNYLGKIMWNKGNYRTSYKWRGSGAVRTDVSQLIMDMYNYLGKSLVDGKDYQYREKYLNTLTDKVLNYDLSLEEIGSPKQLKKELKEYMTPVAHVKASRYSNAHLGTSYRRGNKPMWAYVHSPPGFADTEVIAFTDDTPIPDGFVTDVSRVVKRQIQPTINRFLRLVGEEYKIPLKAIVLPPHIQAMQDKKQKELAKEKRIEDRKVSKADPNKLLHYFG